MTHVVVQDDYKVQLEIFEGPLDLLLYLIKKAEVDIYDIPLVLSFCFKNRSGRGLKRTLLVGGACRGKGRKLPDLFFAGLSF